MKSGEVFFLAVVQSLTEFLPVSSSGHLAVIHARLGHDAAPLALDVALHFGTLLSIFLFFRKDLFQLGKGVVSPFQTRLGSLERRRLLFILAATVPTGILGLFLKSYVEGAVMALNLVGVGFLVTSGLLWGGERSFFRAKKGFQDIPFWHVLVLGTVQGLAVWPGISRSGATIAAALMLGWRWEEAAKFSFLLAIPAVGGATLLMARDMVAFDPLTLFMGVGVAFAGGCLALFGLMKFLAARCLWPFSVYTGLLAIWALVFGS